MSIDDDCCEKGCGDCGKDGCSKNDCCDDDACCNDDGCKECCAKQNRELTVSSKMIFLFRILGGILLILSLIDFGLSAAIGAEGLIAFGWTEFCLVLISITAGVFALIPFNRTFMIVLFSFSLTSSILTFIAIVIVGKYVEVCRAYELDDDYTNNGFSDDIVLDSSICGLIDADFSFILIRFFVILPLCVFSGIKLFGKTVHNEEGDGPRVVGTKNPVINNSPGK